MPGSIPAFATDEELSRAGGPRAGWFGATIEFARRRPLGAVGAGIILLMVAMAATAGLVAPYDPLATDYASMLAAPSAEHWLGTDAYGRDVLTRILYGSRPPPLVGGGGPFPGTTPGAVLGTGAENVILAIAAPMVPRCARVVRASALAVREMPYVDAARAGGYGHARIILRHMLPNVMAPILIMATAFLGEAILLEASLSFLGLG